ncbi:aromatic ring-hydroxylating oxygenase subunit alpha [Novosphingobium sp. JCM 18896]|uniref:aromatic ring-hydroxylating oxygenase subunit alpha n=1 Tax=Novosphingobium sp. JCM 18896 TaxID=2989731 RepID=UPI0022227DF7|nr:aromatic ring-hydroxylating dioxygenase subunit alpha [Novosphingobium sp. JCM 18896]MCW1432303.1 aromatic ring-hydroxylating dioxygenase subunit alpha [Novosphingobium sp. JCM 18896]
MQIDLQRKLFDEISGYINTNTTCLAASEMPHLGSSYIDPEYLAREKDLLRTLPQIVGHSSSLAEPNSYIAHNDTGVPILVVRQADGSLKAFLNICRHRAARLCEPGKGKAKLFTCPYHAWTYSPDGKLAGLMREGFPNISSEQSDLIELPVEERHGLIWLVGTPGAEIDVAAFLGPLDTEFESFPMTNFVLERDAVIDVDINWKFVLDGFLEVYHIPKLHTTTIAPWFFGRHSPFEIIGPHSRLVGIRKSFTSIKDGAFEDSEFLRNIAINYQVFPNSFFIWQGDHFEIWTSYPGEVPGKCKVRVQSLCKPEMIGAEFEKRWDRNWSILLGTVEAEDWAMSKEVQASLPHVPGMQILFGANEPGMQHFHSELDKLIEAAR